LVGTHTFLPTERVHFGAGSLEKIEEEARSEDRAFVVTGRTLIEGTDLVGRTHSPPGRVTAARLYEMVGA
jgi:maleylacetate reductase